MHARTALSECTIEKVEERGKDASVDNELCSSLVSRHCPQEHHHLQGQVILHRIWSTQQWQSQINSN